MTPEERLKKHGIVLPAPVTPAGAYRAVLVSGGIAYVSGQGPVLAEGGVISGKVPDICSPERAREAARLTGLNALAVLRAEIGSLDRVEQILRIFGLVNAVPGFQHHPKVIDGYSELMIEVFGEAGRAARCAVGAPSLPFDICVEVEMQVKISG